MDDGRDDGMEDGMDGWEASFHPDVHGWMMGRMMGWMTRRIKGKLHDVLAIFSYCPKVLSVQKLHSPFTICNYNPDLSLLFFSTLFEDSCRRSSAKSKLDFSKWQRSFFRGEGGSAHKRQLDLATCF
jgi:hypothetical protein